MFSSSSSELFAHLRIPHKEIVNATNHFSDANLIRGNNIRKEYKGQLLRSGQLIDIVVRRQRFKRIQKDAYREHWMEVSMLSKLKHRNIVSIVGCCDENMEMIVVNKHEAMGSLDNFLRDQSLTWMRRLQICVGVARALSFIYYDQGRDFSVIHRDIRSFNILLDHQWEAKLSGFEHSMNQTAARRNHLFLTDVCGTKGYIDPTYIKTGSVTHKSDIYSFGVVLFEVLCGKEATETEDSIDDGNKLASLVRSHYEGGRLEDMIDSVLWKQMSTKSFKLFSETAYHCLNEQRQQRPNIDQIIIKLEQALESQRKYEISLISNASKVDRTTTKTLKGKDLKHLEIPLIDIEMATENFAKTYLIGSGTYGDVYKAELEHFDIEKFFQLEEKSIELPKKRSIVAIKRIKNREDQQGEKGFLAEIEMLTNCNHPNIVSLHGFCEEGDHMILVYEHASKGSLSDYVGITDNLTNLSWVQRIKICIDIARGLDYLHTKIEDERRIIHRDIKSDNILLSENWQAKIADFGLSKFRPGNPQLNNTLYTKNIAGTELYLDPEYYKTGKLKNESDIYSFGVVLFEMLSGRFANDPTYTKENINGIAAVARRCFNEGTIREMVDPKLMEETHEYIFTLNRGPHKDSLDAFSKIAYQCVAESQAHRPPAQVIIKKLEEALYFQENPKDHLKFSLDDIESATENFSNLNFISEGRFGKVYTGEVTNANGRYNIVAKRMHRKIGGSGQGEPEFLTELQMLLEYKHKNIIGLVGYCNEMDERIIVYEYASRKSLDMHLKNNDLTWRKRLQICIDVASGLDFLHGGSLTQDVVIHRDIKSANILLGHDWKAKISDFGHSLISPINKDIDFVIDNPEGNGTKGYVDPLYHESGMLTQESDIFSLGVVLLEILCGTLVFGIFGNTNTHQFRIRFLTASKGNLDKIVFEGIKDQIAPNSLTTFVSLSLQCVYEKREERPTIGEVLLQLKKALEFQEDYEIWEPKLPKDYKEIFQMSNTSDIYSTQREKDLYNMLCNGIILQKDKLLFTLERNGERNVMTSAKTFSYINRCRHKWQSAPESRFQVVAEMLDILNLKIKIKIKPQLLSPDVVYGVYLVFKFCDRRKVLSKPVYVNLKYRHGSRSALHAYFATWRDNEWMIIELHRFLNNKTDILFNFLLESLSGYYCGNSTIYIEGIEFRAIDMNVKQVEIKELKETQQVLKSGSNMDLVQQLPINSEETLKRSEHNVDDEKLFLLSEMNGKKHLMFSAKAALYDHYNVKNFNAKPSAQSRFREVIELLQQQVFRINCKVRNQMLSADTEYVCYLVFKLSEKCRGLHCPVKVRDLLHRNNKEVEIIYFRSPRPWNLHATNQAPQQREDGCMEVKIWKFNLNRQLIKNDCFRVNLQLVPYEGTMSGLIVCGLDFRPM